MASSTDSLPDADSEARARGNWSHKCDYLLATTGFVIGLGNVWRFPYLCFVNGGGAFLVPYLLTLMLVGMTLFFLETSVAQFSSSSCLAIFSVCPAFKGVGMASLAINVITLTYYAVLVSYPVLFLVYSFTWDLPWASCGNSWNSPNCTVIGLREGTSKQNGVSSADEFFHQKLLRISSGIDDLGHIEWPVVIVTFVVFTFLFFCAFKGIRILGKVVWFTAIFPFVMLFILLIRGVTLPGATDGIYFYIYPEFNRLKEMKVWAAAAIQIFYTLGPGWGSLICFGSYNKFNNRCTRDALIVPVLCCSTSILAGFVVFSVLGFMAKRTGVSVEELAVAGPALVFVAYPEALSLMPIAPMWSVFFFLMLFFVGIDSCFAHIETPVGCIMDAFPKLRRRRGWITFIFCSLAFSVSILFGTSSGMYWITLVDWYCAMFTTAAVSFCQLCIFSYIYGAGRTMQDFQLMTRCRIGYGWWIALLVVTPAVLIIFVCSVMNLSDATYQGHAFPTRAQSIGWVIALSSLLLIPAYFLYFFFFRTAGSLKQRMKTCLSPSPAWGPALPNHREEWVQHRLRFPLRHRLLHPDFCVTPDTSASLDGVLLDTM